MRVCLLTALAAGLEASKLLSWITAAANFSFIYAVLQIEAGMHTFSLSG